MAYASISLRNRTPLHGIAPPQAAGCYIAMGRRLGAWLGAPVPMGSRVRALVTSLRIARPLELTITSGSKCARGAGGFGIAVGCGIGGCGGCPQLNCCRWRKRPWALRCPLALPAWYCTFCYMGVWQCCSAGTGLGTGGARVLHLMLFAFEPCLMCLPAFVFYDIPCVVTWSLCCSIL